MRTLTIVKLIGLDLITQAKIYKDTERVKAYKIAYIIAFGTSYGQDIDEYYTLGHDAEDYEDYSANQNRLYKAILREEIPIRYKRDIIEFYETVFHTMF